MKGDEGDTILQIISRPKRSLILSVHAAQRLVLRATESLSAQPRPPIQPLPELRRIAGTHDEVIDLALLSPERPLLALATNGPSIRLVDVTIQPEHKADSSRERYFGSEVGILEGHDDITICLNTDWSGCWLATGAKDNLARLWRVSQDPSQNRCHSVFSGHTASIGAVVLPTAAPPQGSAAFEDPCLHPPPFMITGSLDTTIKKWIVSAKAGAPPRTSFTRKAHDKDINAIAISPSSTLFASASQDRTAKIWTVDGDVQGVLRGHKRGVWSVAFAPPDAGLPNAKDLVVTGSGDKTVKLWSLVDFSCVRTFEGHSHNVLKVVWLPAPAEAESRRALVASAGADGLVKVWDTASGECQSTLDNHSDRVWALATDPRTGRLISGGGDGVVTFWADTSAATAEAAAAAASARVEQDQQLQNHARRGQYREAIVLALQLRHPARLLALFGEVVRRHPPEPGSISGVKAVDEVVASLDDEQLFELLLRLRDWNTNARTAPVAQRILHVVARSYPASRLVGLRRRGKGLGPVLEALRAYTERHYRRCEELIEESYVVDFVVRGMTGI